MAQLQRKNIANDELSLGALLGMVLDHKWWIASVTSLFALFGVTYALLAMPIYQADALVQVERRSSVNPLADMAQMMGEEPTSSTAAEVQILQSRMVLGRVIERTGLDRVIEPRMLPLVGGFILRRDIQRPEIMNGRPEVWGQESMEVGRLEVVPEHRGRPMLLRVSNDQAYTLSLSDQEGELRLLGNGRIGELTSFENGEIKLRVSSINAPPGAEFTLLHKTMASSIKELRSRLMVSEQGGSPTASTGMLRLTLTGPDPEELRHLLDAVTETFLTQNVQRQSAEVERSLAFLEEQAPELRDQLSNAEERLNEYRVAHDSVDLNSEAESVVEQFVALDSQLSELEFQEAELAQRYTGNHPTYRALLRQKNQLEQRREELERRVDSLPVAQQEVVRRTRAVEVTQAIYVNVLNKIQELQVEKAGTIGNVRIIDTALVGEEPIQPRKLLIIALATLLGGMLSVAAVLLRSLLLQGVESPEQIEEIGLPVYATVPLSAEQKRLVRRVKHRREPHGVPVPNAVLAERDPSDSAIEALRALRTSLHFAMLDVEDNRLVITGPSPYIGKSFITINLGAVCAQVGQRVLIVDADMRKGTVHHAFGGRSVGGLSEVLSGKTTLDEVIRPANVEGCEYIARGIAPPNPSELLMSTQFSQFLGDVSNRYDRVIIDTPPVLAVTDASIVAKQCGTTLMVARFKYNPVKELQIAERRLETAGVVVKGVILNAMEAKAATAYGYGYYNYSYK